MAVLCGGGRSFVLNICDMRRKLFDHRAMLKPCQHFGKGDGRSSGQRDKFAGEVCLVGVAKVSGAGGATAGILRGLELPVLLAH